MYCVCTWCKLTGTCILCYSTCTCTFVHGVYPEDTLHVLLTNTPTLHTLTPSHPHPTETNSLSTDDYEYTSAPLVTIKQRSMASDPDQIDLTPAPPSHDYSNIGPGGEIDPETKPHPPKPPRPPILAAKPTVKGSFIALRTHKRPSRYHTHARVHTHTHI